MLPSPRHLHSHTSSRHAVLNFSDDSLSLSPLRPSSTTPFPRFPALPPSSSSKRPPSSRIYAARCLYASRVPVFPLYRCGSSPFALCFASNKRRYHASKKITGTFDGVRCLSSHYCPLSTSAFLLRPVLDDFRGGAASAVIWCMVRRLPCSRTPADCITCFHLVCRPCCSAVARIGMCYNLLCRSLCSYNTSILPPLRVLGHATTRHVARDATQEVRPDRMRR